MADFQSSLTAAELESRWVGTVVSNDAQNLSEAEKAQARENIGAVAFGSNLKILAHFETYNELENSVINPKVGDCYSVGTAVPYTLYVFDGLRNSWKDYGAIRAADVSTRTLTDVLVRRTEWQRDDPDNPSFPYSDFPCRAILYDEAITENDFPMILLSPVQAASGDYCPISFSFNGHVDIFARVIPSTDISIPVITFITEGST